MQNLSHTDLWFGAIMRLADDDKLQVITLTIFNKKSIVSSVSEMERFHLFAEEKEPEEQTEI